MFEKKGIISIEKDENLEEEIMEKAMENGAEDIKEFEEVLVIESAPEDFNTLLEAISEIEGVKILESNVDYIAKNEVEVDEETAQKVEKLIEMLEEDDDVQNVIHNMA